MDLLVKHVTFRNIAALLVISIAVRLGIDYQGYPRAAYLKWRYPPIGVAGKEGTAILADNEKRAANRVQSRYRRVLAMLEQAKAQGFQVSGLERKAQAAIGLNVPAYRRQAIKFLGEIEMAVPRAKPRLAPLGPSQAPSEEVEEDLAPAPAPEARRKRGRR